MQKVKTQEYEVMARLLCSEQLFEVHYNEKIFITLKKDFFVDAVFWQWKRYPYLLAQNSISSAHTVRGAWKKAYKILNGNNKI